MLKTIVGKYFTIFPFQYDVDTFIALNIHYMQDMDDKTLLKSSEVMNFSRSLNCVDVNKSFVSLKSALLLVFRSIANGGKVLFVRSRTMAPELVSKYVSKSGQHFAFKPIGGLLTNWITFGNLSSRISSLQCRLRGSKNHRLNHVFARKIAKWTKFFVNPNWGKNLPKALVITCDEQVTLLIKEANKLKIPVIGLTSSLTYIKGVDFVVPICHYEKLANMFVYKSFISTCSIASMTFERKKVLSFTYTDLGSPRAHDKQFILLQSCLYFKGLVLDLININDASSNLLTTRFLRMLDLKLVFRWLLSLNLSPSTNLQSIIRYVAISQLRMIGNKLTISSFSRKLYINLQMIHSLVREAKRTSLKGFVQNWTETMRFAIPCNAFLLQGPKYFYR
ncbi:MAG: 30S ribosomal protein S2 [Candidatus Hodgkinia cicadicola]